MEQSQKIKTLKLIRSIRDAHYEYVKDLTSEERIAFYSGKAQILYNRLEEHIQKLKRKDVSV